MKPVALLSIPVFLLFGTSIAPGQFRGSAAGGGAGTTSMAPAGAGGRSSAAPIASGVASGRAAQPPQSFRGSIVQPPIQSSQRFHNQSFSSHPQSIQRHRVGGGFGTSHFVGRRPHFVLGFVPHHRHRHWFFHRHPGILILEAPYYLAGSTVITQVAPGVVRADRHYSDRSPSDEHTRIPRQLAPFDPTPHEVVERMLVLAAVKKDDVIYDLGSGDGRILITAAKKYGVRGVGFEIDAGLVKLARENARMQGVEKLVEIRQQDFLTADLSPASVVTLYLSPEGNLAIRQQLMNQLKPGARVVSYTFDMGEWQPKISESYRDAAGDSHLLHLWQIGEPMVFSDNSARMLQPPSNGPQIVDVQ